MGDFKMRLVAELVRMCEREREKDVMCILESLCKS